MSASKLVAKLTKKLGREPSAAEIAKAEAKKAKKKAAKAAEAEAAAAAPEKKAKKAKKRSAEAGGAEKPLKKSKKAKPEGVEAWRAENRVTVEPGEWAPATTWDAARASAADALIARCEGKKWPAPTPIQAQCWPVLAAGRDCVAVAETGSGKTLAFGVPALTSFGKAKRGPKQPAMLVLAPTRELAQQSFGVLEEFCAAVGATAAVAYGGMPKRDQVKALRTCAALVATPGRLRDFVEEGSVDLSAVSFLCLDEADRMLDMGFVHEVRAIAAACSSPAKLTCMFSATWPAEVRRIASEFLRDDFVKVTVGAQREAEEGPEANKRIAQTVHVVDERARDAKLLELLRSRYTSGSSTKYASTKLIVFGLYKKECARMETMLNRAGWTCGAIHGDLSQAARNAAFENFKAGKVPLLVATDVAARGLDIPNVELVVNFSFPLTIEDYVHRIGRTGRAGKTGEAVTFFHGDGHEKALAGALQNVLRGAGADVPAALLKFGSTVKKKEHKSYGAFGPKKGLEGKTATKITF